MLTSARDPKEDRDIATIDITIFLMQTLIDSKPG